MMKMPPLSYYDRQDGYDACEELEPISRKRELKTFSKGDLVRYVLELEDRIERYRKEL